uniref:Uncharacterized protein n=1 Tax=Anopheles coluzzii TaxID=1518534 RepID=A0A8W7PZS9_ANOCL
MDEALPVTGSYRVQPAARDHTLGGFGGAPGSCSIARRYGSLCSSAIEWKCSSMLAPRSGGSFTSTSGSRAGLDASIPCRSRSSRNDFTSVGLAGACRPCCAVGRKICLRGPRSSGGLAGGGFGATFSRRTVLWGRMSDCEGVTTPYQRRWASSRIMHK